MDLISTVDQMLLADEPLISLHPVSCLHTIDRLNTCETCVRACPVGAISLADGPRLDTKQCTGCGLCLRVCPQGAFHGEDGVEDLFRCLQALGKVEALELCCNRHPAPETGPQNFKAALKLGNCLGVLGPSVFLGLFLMGVSRVSLRLDACCACRLSGACSHILRAAESANAFFSAALDWSQLAIEPALSQQPDWVRRAVVDVKRPPVSRRGFFTSLVSQPSLTGVGRFITETIAPDAEAQQPSREQQRLAKALSLYHEVIPQSRQSSLDQLASIPDLRVAEACTACGVCAAMCRTGALDFVEDEECRFTLLFSPARCTDCGVCADYCDAGAIRLSSTPNEGIEQKYRAILEPHPVISGELRRCERCHVSFRKRASSVPHAGPNLCPVCDFRRSNPFGFTLPRNTALLQHNL